MSRNETPSQERGSEAARIAPGYRLLAEEVLAGLAEFSEVGATKFTVRKSVNSYFMITSIELPAKHKEISTIAIYTTHAAAEAAIKQLQEAGFDMKKLSIIARDHHTDEHVVGYYNTGDRMKYWGKMGAFWGGIWGWVFGAAAFFIPGLGLLVIGGPLVGWLVGALEGAVIVGGVSALGAGLVSIGIPKDSILQYETALKDDKFVLIFHGSAEESAQANEILGRSGPETLDRHS